ncbi:MAG: hypothetical protein ACRD5G_06735 [Candidatus Acidiferrales bacterium]
MQAATQAQQPQSAKATQAPQCGPICCKRPMREMVRRAILRADASVVFCSVWHCLNCGRLLL